MLPTLAWIPEFHASFNRAAEISSTYSIEDTVNPLVKHIIFHLSEPLTGENYQPFQTLAHGFAKINNCVLERIYHKPDRLVLVICIKRRFGPVRQTNPLTRDKPGLFKKR